jgi:hypothetical protein
MYLSLEADHLNHLTTGAIRYLNATSTSSLHAQYVDLIFSHPGFSYFLTFFLIFFPTPPHKTETGIGSGGGTLLIETQFGPIKQTIYPIRNKE